MEDEPLDGCGADDEILFHLHPPPFPWDPLCWLQKCVLVAPRDGVVAEVMTVPDQQVKEGQSLATLVEVEKAKKQ
jgi:hypothetical protein